MNRYDWSVVACIAAVVLERFAEAVGDGLVGDGSGFCFITAAEDELALYDASVSDYALSIMDRHPYINRHLLLTEEGGRGCYRPEQVMQCVIEELIERSMLALADAPSKIYWEGEE